MKLNILRIKRLFICLLALVLAVSMTFTGFAEEVSDGNTATVEGTALSDSGYELLCENDALELYGAVNGEYAGTFALKNKEDGTFWYSNPLDSEEDYIALNMMRLKSMLAIEYYDEDNNTLMEINSRADSVDMDGFSIKADNNSATFRFEFPDVKIVIPVEVIIGENGSLTVRINMEEVEENGEYKLFTVALLPYFMADNTEDDGFLFVPDGSGAVMNFNNRKLTYAAYSAPVYGGDYGEILDEQRVVTERVTMPVFGIASGKGGIFSVITEGASQSIVSATVAGVDSCYNAVWNSFEVRSVTTYSLDQGWQGKKVFSVYQETKPTIKTLENTYFFLNTDKANIGGMAETYRRYLTENGLEDKEDSAPNVYIDYLGAVMRQKSVLGFPASVKTVVTDFSDAKEITEGLVNNGVEGLVVRYLNWNTQSITGKIVNKAKADGKLGGKKEFEALAEYLKEENIEFYPDVSLAEYSKNNYPLQQFFSATRNLNKEINKYYPYKLNLYTKDKKRDPHYLLSLTKLSSTAEKFFESYNKLDLSGLSLSGITSYVTADYNSKRKYFGTCDGEQIYSDIIKQASGENTLLVDNANMFAAIYANHIVNTEGNSGYDMLDYGVPFYQMTLSGLVGLSGEPINLESDSRETFLRAIESGSGLHYALSFDSSTENITDTAYEHWIGTDYEAWTPVIAEQWNEMCKVYEWLGSHRPVSYEIDPSGLAIVGFESGSTLLINYEEAEISYRGLTVESMGYAVLKGGELVGQSE